MTNTCQYGSHRGIEPENSFPNLAWRLNNSAQIFDNEILIEVSLLNIDSKSFKQIYVECHGNVTGIKNKILEIVQTRGKLHNPITGTGGIFCGKVIEIGENYTNDYILSLNDIIISLSSLTLTPLYIEEIINIDVHTGQVEIRGKAILFSHSPLLKAPIDLPIKLLLAVLDEAGAAIQSYNLAEQTNNILIIGASGKIGLMCAYAIRKKIGRHGRLIGVRSPTGDMKFKEALSDIFDEVHYLDALKPIETFENIMEKETAFDLVINCINVVGTEMLSILCTKETGILYLASLGNNYKSICSCAEGLAKDLNIIGYKGFSKDHAHFTIDLLRENPILIQHLNKCLERNFRRNSISNKLMPNKQPEINYLKDINLEEYVFDSPEIQKVLDNTLKVAAYDCTVLITGESGVGKEIFATLIHKCSDRNHLPSIKINCGSIPKDLLESELFGYEKGAFTGADKNGKIGFFEIASGGTLFLDEIGELPMELQVKLLRAIAEKEIYRVGSVHPIKVDVRILGATNKNLQELINKGKFREDLYYRLNVFPIEIPPLRERVTDIIPLIMNYTKHYNKKFKLNKTFEDGALNYLLNYNWPGNIRELENLVQRLLISVNNDLITLIDVARNIKSIDKINEPLILDYEGTSLQEILNNKEFDILKAAKEKYSTTRKISKALGLSQSTLVRKLNKYNL